MTHLVFFEKPGCGGSARQRSDDQSRHVGFGTAAVDAWIGLGTEHASPSLEDCASPTERSATHP
jgi:hypothetical protein